MMDASVKVSRPRLCHTKDRFNGLERAHHHPNAGQASEFWLL